MIAKVSNQDFGWSVACDGYWAAVGNPNPFRYDPLTSSLIRTGSVEVYKYNINTDVHDVKSILYRRLSENESVLLTTEFANVFSGSGPYYPLHTEYTGSVPITSDLDIAVNVEQYYSSSEDGYGWAIDLKNTILAIGCPYYTSTLTLETDTFVFSGSGQVDLFDVSTLDVDPYAQRSQPVITSTGSVGGFITVYASVPSGQNFKYVIFQTKDTFPPNSNWSNIALATTSNGGGNVTLQTNYTTFLNLETRVVGVVGTDPYLTTITNPNTSITNSFGYSVSLNDEWLAVGSPLESGSKGAVFMYRKYNGNNLSWSLVQTLPLPSDIGAYDNFGSDIGMNKLSSSFSWSMIVGSNKPSSSKAYIYEFNGTNWTNTFTLSPDL